MVNMFRLRAVLYAGVVLYLSASVAGGATQYNQLAFIANSRRTRSRITASPAPVRENPSQIHSANAPLFLSQHGNNDDVFLLSFDGTLASTSRARSWMAIFVALRVWPALKETMVDLGIDPEAFKFDAEPTNNMDESYEWLIRKLSALASITQQGNNLDAMLGCDAVLLARVLLEEQLLDGGRSNGRGGKYGGKFHPSSSNSDTENGSKVGSRPLTVGELYVNWPELRDVTRMKYPFIEENPDGKLKRKDPLPEIRQWMKKCLMKKGERSNNISTWQSIAYDILFDYQSIQNTDEGIRLRQNAMILLGHDAQIPLLLNTLSSLGGCSIDIEYHLDDLSLHSNGSNDGSIDMKVVVTTVDKAWERLELENSCNDDPSLMVVVPQQEESHSNMIEKIITDINSDIKADSNRNVYVLHSSLEVLKQCKSFLGDDAPLLNEGLRQCSLSNAAVTLFLPGWADNVHPTQENDGEMDPWLNLVSEEQILELLSAEITAAPLS